MSQQVIQLYAGDRPDGSPVLEEVVVEPVEAGRVRVLQSPGLVLGIAAGDVIEPLRDGKLNVISRGRNLNIQLFFRSEPVALEREAKRRLGPLGGRMDGKAGKQLVFTVPVSAGFPAVEKELRELTTDFPGVQWYYGNVYDPGDGVTPLNWW